MGNLRTSQLTTITTCNGQMLKALIQGGLAWLEQNYEFVNHLNVYPVPDGDTGTNMLLTMRAAYQAIASNETESVGDIARKMAHGALYGSCGNSGTALSQLFTGFAEALDGKLVFDAPLLAAGFRAAVRAAYRTFQEPVEGTILTVAREIAEEVESAAAALNSLREILGRAVDRGKRAVARTPEILPILKKAGVVDSGGQGLVIIFEGMLRAANGEDLSLISDQISASTISRSALSEAYQLSDEFSEDGFGYDVQYIIQGKHLDVDAIRTAISAMGDSAIIIGDPSVIKVHVHVKDPDIPLGYGKTLGDLYEIKIEDMQAQSEQYRLLRTGGERIVPIAVVAVAPGEGIAHVFRDLGAAEIVFGGQTMNPSAGEMVEAVRNAGARSVILLPNNKNVILSANQAARIIAESGDAQRVLVLPTRTVPQGIAAMYNFSADGTPESVLEAMHDSANQVITGEITIATRDLNLEGLDIKAGQAIGLADGVLVVAGDNLTDVVRDLLLRVVTDDSGSITLLHGTQVSVHDAGTLVGSLRADFSSLEFTVIDGGQPLYPYILSIE